MNRAIPRFRRPQVIQQVIHRVPLVLLALSLALLLCPRPSAARTRTEDPAEKHGNWDSDRIQVQITPGARIAEINARYQTTTLDSLPPLYLLGLPNGVDPDSMISMMSGDAARFVNAEYSYRNGTPEGTRQMVVAAVGGTIHDYLDQHVRQRLHLADIHARTTGEGITVAVLDTGVRADHEALAGAIAPDGYDFVDNTPDPADRADGIDEDNDGTADEEAGHGTLVAGIIHLVAPGARILPIRVLNDEGKGSTFSVAKGIRYAVEHGARVINLSLGLDRPCGIIAHELETAREASVVVVGAAGNADTDTLQFFPASDPRVLMVAALDSSDVKADFSNYCPKVALSAPGVGIMGPYYDGGYAIGAGTSFAAPFVSGQCALIMDLDPGLDWGGVYARVPQGVVDISAIAGNEAYIGKLGTGRFDGVQTLLSNPGSNCVAGNGSRAGGLQLLPNPVSRGQGVRIVCPSSSRVQGASPQVVVPSPQTGATSTGLVFNAQGRLVRRFSTFILPDASDGAVGEWDGRDQGGRLVPPGLYFVRLAGAAGAPTGRVVVR